MSVFSSAAPDSLNNRHHFGPNITGRSPGGRPTWERWVTATDFFFDLPFVRVSYTVMLKPSDKGIKKSSEVGPTAPIAPSFLES